MTSNNRKIMGMPSDHIGLLRVMVETMKAVGLVAMLAVAMGSTMAKAEILDFSKAPEAQNIDFGYAPEASTSHFSVAPIVLEENKSRVFDVNSLSVVDEDNLRWVRFDPTKSPIVDEEELERERVKNALATERKKERECDLFFHSYRNAMKIGDSVSAFQILIEANGDKQKCMARRDVDVAKILEKSVICRDNLKGKFVIKRSLFRQPSWWCE